MASVIEHQKVARRRRSPDLSRDSGLGTYSDFFSRPAHPRRGLLARSRAVLPLRRETRSRTAAAVGHSSTFATAGSSALAEAVPNFVRSTARITRRVLPESLFVLDYRDLPLYIAVLSGAILVNMMLLGAGVDRIVLSSAIRDVTLPVPRELITRSTFSPGESDFSVIGETSGVDTDTFSRLEVTTYAVRPGDTLGAIAIRNGLELDTLISFNRIEDVRRIQAGSTFEIPDRDGLLYTVRRGDSVSSIAAEHSTTVNAILDSNDLRSGTVREGEVLFVPGARMNNTELRIILGELFAWPMRGVYTSGFGMRPDPFTGQTRFHNGIDLSNAMGTPVRAAASGRVVHVESQIGNYGRFVIVRHADGFQTLYAHLDSFSVRSGQTVSRGEMIGRMGNTGRSTGPHLHFSVVHNGRFVNPMQYLH